MCAAIYSRVMDWAEILTAGAEGGDTTAKGETRPIHERIPMLPNALSVEEVADDKSFLTVAEGLQLVRSYFLTGNLAASCRELGVKYPVALRASKEVWWADELSSLDSQAKIAQKTRLSGLLGKAIDELEDRLENGDTVVIRGEHHIVPLGGRDLAAIASVLFEKRAILEADGATKVATPNAKLKTLADSLRDRVSGPVVGEADGSQA